MHGISVKTPQIGNSSKKIGPTGLPHALRNFPLKSSFNLFFFQVMTGQTEGAPAAGGYGTGGCANSLTCGGVGLGGLGSARFNPWYHFDETGDLKPEYKYWSLNNG